MRRKRKKKRRRSIKHRNYKWNIYSFTNFEIRSFAHLTEEQLDKVSKQVENIINSSNISSNCEIAKQILIQMKNIVLSVQCDYSTLFFCVTINEKYFN